MNNSKNNSHLFSILLVFVLMFIFTSCSKEIEIDTRGFKKQLVVNSLFHPKIPFSFDISLTQTPIDTFTIITDSIYIALYEENRKVFETKTLSNSLSTYIMPQWGSSYQLKVYVEGFDTLYACDTIPQMISIVDAYYIGPISVDKYGCQSGKFNFSVLDPAETHNYYEFEWGYYENVKAIDPVFINEGDVAYQPTTHYFSDELFNGKNYNFSIVSGLSQNIGWQPTIVLKSVSRNYYLYRKYLTRHLATQPTLDLEVGALIFKSEPQPMYSNIKNGVGIFAGYCETDPVYFRKINSN
jgi:hypothetical protein